MNEEVAPSSSTPPTATNDAEAGESAAGTPQGNCPAVGIDQMNPEDSAKLKRE